MHPLVFILASGNTHKAQELSRYLSSSITVQAAPETFVVKEDGKSFEENAFKKAVHYFQCLKHPTVADDSGLMVEALPDELGIHSARFGGEGLSDHQRSLLLLEKLENEPNRKACFISYLCFYLAPEEVFFFEGRLNGIISEQFRGDRGFGYDPVFIPQKDHNALTLAQQPEWKDQHSHRSQACQAAKTFFESMTRA